MSRKIISKYVTFWKFRRGEDGKRLDALRKRDGENCRRCRRAIRFDLPSGHDRAPKIETVFGRSDDEPVAFENLCLCHHRCNSEGNDHTSEVQERVRRKNEAALFAGSRAARSK
jgi:hypothetical protein